jgi:hypothetical protein
VSKLKRLIQSYERFIRAPWRDDVAAAQRVIFCVYDPVEERALRAKIEEFELTTGAAGHGWRLFDLTDTFALWLSSQRYAQKYFDSPELLANLLPKYRTFLAERFTEFLRETDADHDTVVAIAGVGSLFGLCKVKDVVDAFAPHIRGRLLVFFPGSFENNNYRLLDGYDGWNYLAVPITADQAS